MVGELDGVVDEVDEDLTETEGIADQGRGNLRRRGNEELEILVLGLVADDDGKIVERIFKLEFSFLDIQLAGFDLGEVEDVVDDAQQRLGGGLDLVQVIGLFRQSARSSAPGGSCR